MILKDSFLNVGVKRRCGKVENKEAINLLKCIQSPLQDYAEWVSAPCWAYGKQYVYPDPEDYAIEQAISALEKEERYKWHDLKNNPNDLPEVFIDYEVEDGKFSDKILVKTDKYDTLMVAYMNLSTGEWFNELNEDECFYEEYGNVVKWKYIDYE